MPEAVSFGLSVNNKFIATTTKVKSSHFDIKICVSLRQIVFCLSYHLLH